MRRLQRQSLKHAIDSVSKFFSYFEYGGLISLYCFAFILNFFDTNPFIDLLESEFKLEKSNS